MGYIVSTVWFPPVKGEEMGKKFLEITKKHPADKTVVKLILAGALMRTKYGIKGMSIYEVKEGKLEAAFDWLNEVLAAYSEIEGVNSTIETMTMLVESMELIGLKVPE